MGMRTEGERTSFLLLAEEKKTRWMQKKKKPQSFFFLLLSISSRPARRSFTVLHAHTAGVWSLRRGGGGYVSVSLTMTLSPARAHTNVGVWCGVG